MTKSNKGTKSNISSRPSKSAITTTKAAATATVTDEDSNNILLLQLDPHTAKVLWRDVSFLVLGCIIVSIVGFVETHASDPDACMTVQIAGKHIFNADINPNGIVDTKYIITQPLYEVLRDDRYWNDVLATLNSVALIFPSIYVAYVTVWKGDYSLSFCVLAIQLLRSFCGWFTYLPPDPHYLNSYFDFPDIVQCLFQECSGKTPQVLPFVSFFSGHVATMVVAGNHMWLCGHVHMAIVVHVLNVLQIIRLLATRGHYSIDIIIGWYVAVYVSNPAGRLGRYYSRGVTVQEILPKTPLEALEHVTGVTDARNESRMSALLKRKDIQTILQAMEKTTNEEDWIQDDDNENDSTAQILQEAAAKILQERSKIIQERMQYLQQQGQEQLSYMKQQGEEKMAYFKEQASQLSGGGSTGGDDYDSVDHDSSKNKKDL